MSTGVALVIVGVLLLGFLTVFVKALGNPEQFTADLRHHEVHDEIGNRIRLAELNVLHKQADTEESRRRALDASALKDVVTAQAIQAQLGAALPPPAASEDVTAWAQRQLGAGR